MAPGGTALEKRPEVRWVWSGLRGGARCSGGLVRLRLTRQPVRSGHRTVPQDHKAAPAAQPLGPDVHARVWKYFWGPQVWEPIFQSGPQFRTQISARRRRRGFARWGKSCFSNHRLPSLKAVAEETLKSLRPYGGPPK